jgi:hypothetical protein
VLSHADVSASAAAQNQLAESEHPVTHCSHAVEDSRMNIVVLMIVILAAYWLSSLIID